MTKRHTDFSSSNVLLHLFETNFWIRFTLVVLYGNFLQVFMNGMILHLDASSAALNIEKFFHDGCALMVVLTLI